MILDPLPCLVSMSICCHVKEFTADVKGNVWSISLMAVLRSMRLSPYLNMARFPLNKWVASKFMGVDNFPVTITMRGMCHP